MKFFLSELSPRRQEVSNYKMITNDPITLSSLELSRFFCALVLLLLFAHTFGYLFHRIKLPRVIGEIAGGLLLGPSGLGFFAPNLYHWLFSAFTGEGKLISMIAWIGLVLLMFISGFEIRKSLSREDKTFIFVLTLGSTALPFLAGWMAPSLYDFSPYLGEKKNIQALQLVIAIATAVTSIPVIAKIFMDLDIINTHFAKIVLATATIHDIVLWVALAVATGLVSTQSTSVAEIGYVISITLFFFGFALLVVPRLIGFLNDLRWNLILKASAAGYVLFLCFLFAAVSSILNVNVVFGAFLGGIVIGNAPQEQLEREKAHIKEVSLALFIPIYFAVVGLKLDLMHHLDVLFLFSFLLFTTVFEMLGTIIAAKLMQKDWLSSFNLGVAMTTRGGPGIVLATVTYDTGIINDTFFVTLVLIAILTSLLAGSWFKYLLFKGLPLLAGQANELTRRMGPRKAPRHIFRRAVREPE
jgi:Kef-type K+ transport system membrane component KefB